MKKFLSVLLVALATSSAFGAAIAQPSAGAASQNVVQLSATGTVDVQQDTLVLTLATARDGKDAAAVQSQLRQAVDAALTAVKKDSEASKMEVSTGAFSLSPRYNDKQQISGWEGSAELVLKGSDFPRITSAAARASTMTIGSVVFALSREKTRAVERDAQKLAIEQFKEQAKALVSDFGFTAYSLREVSVSLSNQGPFPQMMLSKSRVSSFSKEPVAVVPGKTAVTVVVSGSVQMR